MHPALFVCESVNIKNIMSCVHRHVFVKLVYILQARQELQVISVSACNVSYKHIYKGYAKHCIAKVCH